MIELINPTGGGIRNDAMGGGFYHAPRGATRKHKGTDFLCLPGQAVYSPIAGIFKRVALPYVGSNEYQGMVIEGPTMSVKLFYVAPIITKLARHVSAGEVIGYAQDISKRYGGGMKAHIHLEIESIDPEVLL